MGIINEAEFNKTMGGNQRNEELLFEKRNKIDKTLARLTKKKRKDSNK